MPRKPRTAIGHEMRDAEALTLRRAGASYDQIAKQMGYAQKSGAHHAVMRALTRARKVTEEDAAGVLELELQRLDVMLLGLWSEASKGRWLAVDRVLKIMERRAAYLGLDAPKKTEMSGPDGGPIQVEQDVTYSIEERRRRILALVADFGTTRALGTSAFEGPDLDSAGGSAD